MSEARRRTRKWLDDNRALYDRARRKVSDPDAVIDAWIELANLCAPALAYQQGAPAHEAVFVLAKMQANLDSFFKEVLFLAEYRNKLRKIEDMPEEALVGPLDQQLMDDLTSDWMP